MIFAPACAPFDEKLHGSDSEGPIGGCKTNSECTITATERSNELGGGGATVPAMCRQSDGECVTLLTEDCNEITGNYLDDDAVFIGSLFSTKGGFGFSISDAVGRQQSAMLAVEEINTSGGIPGASAGARRPLVMVSCDDSTDLIRAGTHLVEDVGVSSIVGPTSSTFVIRLTQDVTARSGTAVLTPTAAAAAIADLDDGGYTYQMVPNDAQRAVVMIQQINQLEEKLRKERERNEIRLAILFRDDALGQGTRAGLDALTLNGRPLADPINLGKNLRIDGFPPMMPPWETFVEAYLELLPDIIVIGAVIDTLAGVILPLEQRWPADKPRPYYIGIDAFQSPPLLDAASKNNDLRVRIRGTGVTQATDAVAVNNSFRLAYSARYGNSSVFVAGMGPAYDATYATAFALAATSDEPASGRAVVEGLKKLSGGSRPIQVTQTELIAAFSELSRGTAINATGTIGALRWNERGSVLGGAVEVWCVGVPGDTPIFQPSGYSYDVGTGMSSGQYKQCPP